MFFLIFLALISLEFYGKIFERGVGNYLKWQNSGRPQLGRIWDRDRQAVLAQSKIQSIRSGRDSRRESTDAIDSFKALLNSLEPAFPLVLSREKFLDLYYDFPGQWSARIISPFELISIDSQNNWTRVLLKRFGRWITIGFLDPQNIPVHEIFLSTDALQETQAARTAKRGRLEEAGFESDHVYSAAVFLPVLRTLDPKTQNAVFPDPRWFLAKGYSITRMGVREADDSESDLAPNLMVFGIEYDTDYYTGVLQIPVPLEIANNMLSQIERTGSEIPGEEFNALIAPLGDNP
ncbi:MAG: hypothetical protein IID18_10285 [Nitrospinae bacterium]|nr:hypothetical protein [Nitrospinota bacterium]